MSKLDKNSVDRALEHFLRRVLLNKGQHERAQQAIISIKTIVRSSDSCPQDADIYEQGSFATRTTLTPDTVRKITAEYDVDIVVESTEWGQNDASSALSFLYNILRDSGIGSDRLMRKTSCIRIRYADGPSGEKFHVDVVPILRQDNIRKAPKCTAETNEWIVSDPSKLTEWFNNKARNEPTFRAQYLLMKRFAQMNGIKMPSIAIQKITSDAYVFKEANSRYLRELLDMCRVAYSNLDNQHYKLTNPINSEENIRKRIKEGELERYKSLLSRIVQGIERFSADGTYEEVINLFGDKFPKKESHEKELSLRSEGIYFDCDFADRVKVTAKAEKGLVEGSKYKLRVSSDHSNRKDREAVDKIKFTAEVPSNQKAIWQIMNDPAEVPFQIRGNYEESNERLPTTEHRTETVSYAGNHFVRAFIIEGRKYKAVSSKFCVDVIRSGS